MRTLFVMIAAVLGAGGLPALADLQVPTNRTAQERRVITSADQLPRRQYAIPRVPSELLEAAIEDALELEQFRNAEALNCHQHNYTGDDECGAHHSTVRLHQQKRQKSK